MKNINIVFNDGFPGWNGETPNTPRPGWAIEEYLEQLVHTAAVLALPPVTEENNGDFMTVVDGEWAPANVTLDEKIAADVDEWLEDHPEATTTVQDGAITFPKLAADLKSLLVHDTVSGPVASFDYAAVGLPFDSAAVTIVPIQSGSGTPSQTNVRPISGITGLSLYVGPTQDQADATEYAEDWSTQAGTVYGGTLDVVTGVLTVDREKVTYDGSENWTAYPSFEGYLRYESSMKHGLRQNGVSNMLKDSKSAQPGQKNCMWLGVNTQYIYVIGVYETMGSTVADFRSYLAENNLEIVFPLATPITYQLTPKQIAALTENYAWASNGGNVSVTFIADTKSYINMKIAEAHA